MHDETAKLGQPFQLDDDLQRAIAAYARENKMSASEVVRAAFEAWQRMSKLPTPARDDEESLLERWTRLGFIEGPSVFDRLDAAGLIGCVDDPSLPSDLATNKSHMEGFGLNRNDASD